MSGPVQSWHLDGDRMARGAFSEIGVELRCDRANERPSAAGHDEPVGYHRDQLIGVIKGITLQFRDEALCGAAKSRPQVGERDLEVAHQPLDGVAAQKIVSPKANALGDRQSVRRDVPDVVAGGGDVLDMTLRKPADRRRAEAKQGRCLVGCVALEIAVQPPRRAGPPQGVVRQREMIDAATYCSRRSAGEGSALSSIIL